MATPTLTGADLAGRIIAFEAIVIALASEILAAQPDDKVAAVVAGIKAIGDATVADLVPELAPRSDIMKKVEKAAGDYSAIAIDRISRARAKIIRDGALVIAKTTEPPPPPDPSVPFKKP